MDELVAWLRDQVAEDRAAALLATPGPWRHNPDKHWRKPGTAWCEEAVFSGPGGADAVCVAGTGNSDDPQSMVDARYIARHDPLDTLARCDAYDAMLDSWEEVDASMQRSPGEFGVNDHMIRCAVLAYRHRPGYQDGWGVM